MFKKCCTIHVIKISKCKISNIINWNRRKAVSHYFYIEKDFKWASEKGTLCFKSVSIRHAGNRENQLAKKSVAKFFNTTVGIKSKIKIWR